MIFARANNHDVTVASICVLHVSLSRSTSPSMRRSTRWAPTLSVHWVVHHICPGSCTTPLQAAAQLQARRQLFRKYTCWEEAVSLGRTGQCRSTCNHAAWDLWWRECQHLSSCAHVYASVYSDGIRIFDVHASQGSAEQPLL